MKSSTWRSTGVAVLALGIGNLGFVGNSQAGIVGTEAMVSTDRGVQLAAIQAQLSRADIRSEFARLGVDAAVVDQRVANLSDSELAALSQKLQNAPAGGDVLVIIGAVFVVLLLLELVGVIDIFQESLKVKGLRQPSSFGLVVCLLIALCGCATHPPLIDSSARPVELADTPFFPQRRYQCGPATLATLLGASHVQVTPDELEPLVYIPGRKGSLQVEMQAAPRAYGRLAYRIEPELAAIVSELDAGRPVLVLHNYGFGPWPRWHYAVAIGHDPQRDELLLRSGLERREVWSARNFMRAWDNGDRWALVVLRPGELPVAPDKIRYLEAAAAFEKVAAPHDAWLAFDSAVKTWPDEPVAWIGRGTAKYRDKNFSDAAADYSSALHLDPTHAGARNNLAMTMLELGCPRAARKQLDRIDITSLDESLREAIADTDRQIALSTGIKITLTAKVRGEGMTAVFVIM